MKSLITTIFLFTLFAIMFASQTMYQSNLEENKTFDIYNFTENNLVWNYTQQEDNIKDNFTKYTKLDYDQIHSKRITNIIHKGVDWFGYTLFEISKWAMEFGYTHPEYDFGFFMKFVLYWLYAMIAIALFPVIVPLIALIYLLIIGIKNGYLWIRKKITPKLNTQVKPSPKKMKKIIYTIIGIAVFVLFMFPIQDFADCYDSYVAECKECHERGMAYALCSGFCFESDNISSGCETDLDKNCEDNIPHGYCVSESYRWRLGILKLWGEEYYSHSYF